VAYVNDAIGDEATAAGYSLGFYTDAAMTSEITNPTSYRNEVQTTQTIYIQVTDDATDCMIAVPLQLFVEEGATATEVPEGTLPAVCDYDGTNDGFTATDLTDAGTIALGSQDPATYSIRYYTSEAAALAGEATGAGYITDPTAFVNTQTPEQIVWIRITNESTQSKCSDITTVTVRVEALPNPAISTADGNYTLCYNFTTGERESDALTLNSGVTPDGHTYDWYRDGVALADASTTSGSYTANEPGNYTVIVTSPAGCVSEPSAVFEVVRSGQAVAIGQGYVVSNAFTGSQTVTVLVEGYGEYQYSLYPEGPWQESNVFTNVSKGTHTVYVRDAKTPNACGTLELSGVSIIDYPNFFTPNQDGYNDTWNIVGLAGTDAKIYIFDRYGKLLKQLSPNSDAANGEGWNGTFLGNQLPADDYWFTVTFTENGVTREYKSHFSMKR
jgi:gliding motility-associated-like protein